ncbi:hypothetical protein C1701_02135 [Actinoalloteichus sp. AHMU CJ021]|uniref:Uncharacterized protein n=2 Tax=Actinoalloteichus cyanogriseus TaxID=2893586 RepID=A0ABT1JG87_ACTCY|nr:hypothetical protein [Actinoalloteichus caeruleus]AUS77365.1 hypothetical protein C1701_02135 [Actinoalloteichus sp. AHMU CJ021]MCP2331186.1 hypothetical protein [Actinoalloteichus caeruleus DSM 43889]
MDFVDTHRGQARLSLGDAVNTGLPNEERLERAHVGIGYAILALADAIDPDPCGHQGAHRFRCARPSGHAGFHRTRIEGSDHVW